MIGYVECFAEKEKLRRRERERELRRVIIRGSKYGYTISVRNPVLARIYEAYKKFAGIHGAPSDLQRFIWERAVKIYICAEYKNMYHTELYEPVIGWQEQRLEECVLCLDPANAESEILKLTAKKKVINDARKNLIDAQAARVTSSLHDF